MLQIPHRFTLTKASDQAIEILTDRVREGEGLLRATLADVTLREFRRAVQRWQAENEAIIDSLLEVNEPPAVYPADYPSDSAANPQNDGDLLDSLKDEVNAEVSELSSLIHRIELGAGGGLDSPLPSPRASVGTFSEADAGSSSSTVATFADSEPSPQGGMAPAADAEVDEQRDDDGEFPSAEIETDEVEADDGEAAEVPTPDVKREPIAYASAASATLPAYDADAVAEQDLIGIDRFVDAFSYLIAARAMRPPLAVGLFGHWGSGKTFLMRAIQRRVDQITRGARESDRDQADIGVYRRVVQIEFNAWHYMEANLWASLVDHIFSNLRTSADESGLELDERRRAITSRLASTGDQKRVLDARIGELQTRRAEKERQVVRLEGQQRVQREQAQRLRLGDVAAAVTLGDDDLTAVADALSRVGLPQAPQSAGGSARSLAGARDVVVRGSPLFAPVRQFGWRWSALLIVIVAVAPLTSLALQSLDLSELTKVVASVAAFLGAATAVAGAGAKWTAGSLTRIEAAEAKVRKRVEDTSAQQARELGALELEIDSLQRQLTEALGERDAATTEIEALSEQLKDLTPGKLLAGFLEQRSSSADYRRHLGVTAMVRRDFEELSRLVAANNDALLTQSPAARQATDFNRIVLYVDDLDRCPPRRVVEVLQAVHLLMSFPVFVVVVAVDPRWLAQSLGSEYRDLLGEGESAKVRVDAQATPIDYLEKIFQVPFSVAPLDIGQRTRFVDALLRGDIDRSDGIASGILPADPEPAQRERASRAEPSVGSPEADRGTTSPFQETPPTRATSDARSGGPSVVPDGLEAGELVDLNPSSLRFSEPEVRYLVELLPLLDTSPRSIKRYINIYRLMKSVTGIPTEASSGTGLQPHESAMFLLAVQTGLHGIGPRLVRAVAEHPIRTPSEAGAEFGAIIDQFAVANGDDLEGVRLREWVVRHPSTTSWPVGAIAPHARHVRLYGFG